MNKGSISGFLFEHTLNTLCKGNKREYARRLEVEQSEIYRLQNRFKTGGVSGKTIEKLLGIYLHEDLSLDQALKQYADQHSLVSDGQVASCYGVFHEVERTIENGREKAVVWKGHSQMGIKLADMAHVFLSGLNRLICTKSQYRLETCAYCDERRSAVDCPCVKFAEFYAWLLSKLTEHPLDGTHIII